jgi:hypothetical protein
LSVLKKKSTNRSIEVWISHRMTDQTGNLVCSKKKNRRIEVCLCTRNHTGETVGCIPCASSVQNTEAHHTEVRTTMLVTKWHQRSADRLKSRVFTDKGPLGPRIVNRRQSRTAGNHAPPGFSSQKGGSPRRSNHQQGSRSKSPKANHGGGGRCRSPVPNKSNVPADMTVCSN